MEKITLLENEIQIDNLNLGFGEGIIIPSFVENNPYEAGYRNILVTDIDGFDTQGVIHENGSLIYSSGSFPTSGGNLYIRSYRFNLSTESGLFKLDIGEAREIKEGGDVISISSNKIKKITLKK